MKSLLLNDIKLSWKLHLLEHLFQREAFNKGLLGIFDSRYGLGAKVSTISLFQ